MAASGTKEEFSDPLRETEPTTEANFTLQSSTDFENQQAKGSAAESGNTKDPAQ